MEIWKDVPGYEGLYQVSKRGKEIHNAKAVVRIDQNGEEKYYDSIADAARDNNIRQSGISGCLCGKNKTSGGYVWRYA